MADIDLWPISTLPVADMVFYVAYMVCGRYRCNSGGGTVGEVAVQVIIQRDAMRKRSICCRHVSVCSSICRIGEL